jgi:hypothetical protein
MWQFYGINANLPSSTSISAFAVLVTDTSGTVETFNNNGAGFPISDSVIVQTPQSCLSNGNLTVLAAVSCLEKRVRDLSSHFIGSRHSHYTSSFECHSEGRKEHRKPNSFTSPFFG